MTLVSPAADAPPQHPGRSSQEAPVFPRWLASLLLLVIVLTGGALRFSHLNWDRSQHVHPDERFMVWVADTLSWPGDLAAALDPARSPLNPYRWPPGAGDMAGKPRGFAYGHLPLYLGWGAANGVAALARWMGGTKIALPAFLQPFQVTARHATEYNYIGLVGRALSAAFDIGTLLLVYWLGRRVYGQGAGLLAAAFYAFSVLPVQLSHFFAVDAPLAFFVTGSVALAARWVEDPRKGNEDSRKRTEGNGFEPGRRPGWGTWLAAGAMAGLAVGTKFSAILLVVPLLVAALLRDAGEPEDSGLGVVLGRLGAALAAGFVAFAITNPFSILEFRVFAQNVLAQNAMVSGMMDAPYTRQFIGTFPYLYFIQQLGQWGLGWPLGITAWGGLIWCIARALRRRAKHPEGASVSEWVMLAWAVPYFAITGLFYAKFLRYMAPLLPFLLVMGAGLLVAARGWLARRWGRAGTRAWGAGVALLFVATFAWQLAFTGVYRQEHPWLQASRWIYRNVPDGARLLTEHWDDALPLRMDGVPDRPPLRAYRQVELPLWDPDSPEKLDTLAAELSSADFVVIASNRLYAPIQRLPRRYPMSSKYYEMLFSGELGYAKAAEFTSYPGVGRLVIADDHADESFTVYDHPHVLIFENRERLSERLLRSRLRRYLPLESDAGIEVAKPRTSRPAPTAQGGFAGKPAGHARLVFDDGGGGDKLLLSQPVESLPVVADFRWNDAASASPWLAAPLWLLAISLFGWLAWPLVFFVVPRLRDRGYGLSRAIGWLLVGWVHWMGVNLGLWENRASSAAAVVALLAVASGVILWRRRAEMRGFLAHRRRLILGEEALFAGAYLAFVGIRLFNPDLWQPWNGGEKFMEFAFLNAILRSAAFPPYDPYFAGGVLNYYYYGLYLVGLPIKLTGIAPEVAFNLAIPSLYALSVLGVFSVGATLGERLSSNGEEHEGGPIAVPLMAVVLALMMGNLASAAQVSRRLASLGGWDGAGGPGEYLAGLGRGALQRLGGAAFPGFDYWAPSRVIPFTINEFPFWTFLFADLHPHLIAIPFGMAVVGLSLHLLLASERTASEQATSEPESASPPDGDLRLNQPLSRAQYALNLLLLALTLGALGAINTWDLPTYFILAAGCLVIAGWRAGRPRAVMWGLVAAALVGVAAVAAYLPFYRGYEVQVGRGAGWALGRYLGWTSEPSPPGDWLRVWGIFLLLAGGFVLLEMLRGRATPAEAREKTPSGFRVEALGWLLGLAVVALLLALGRPTAAIAAAPMLFAMGVALRRDQSPQRAFLAWLLFVGLAVIAGTELIYLRDFLDGGDWYRMNTIFKFGAPAWIFLGLAGGGIVWLLWQRGTGARPEGGGPGLILRRVALIAAGVLVAAGLLFVPLGVPARVDDRFPGARPPVGTLDATAYMTVGKYDWPEPGSVVELRGEREAIDWLLSNVVGSPVVAEAPAGGYVVNGKQVGYDYYRAGGVRVASLTGLPTFVGHHQYEQRAADQVSAQTARGQEFFQTTDIGRARELLRELHVRYVYVGTLERILFSLDSLRKFDVLADEGELEIVFDNGDVRIYRVTGDGG